MENFTFEEQKNTSLRHKITDDIRKAIFSGHLLPGTRLREVEMSKQMGVSRGPIREAMRMLEQEGLLISQPYKETMVSDISREEVVHVLIPIRLTLEQFAVKKALDLLDDSHYAKLQSIIDKMREAANRQDIAQIADYDLQFHAYLVELSGMSNIISIWNSIYNRIRLHFITQARTYDDLIKLCQEHETLLEAIKLGNENDICAALTEHIQIVNWDFLDKQE